MSKIWSFVKSLPLLVEAIRGLEKAFPDKGWGPFRLSLLKKIFPALLDAAKDGLGMDDVIPLLEKTVAAIVEEMNAKPEAWNSTALPAVKE